MGFFKQNMILIVSIFLILIVGSVFVYYSGGGLTGFTIFGEEKGSGLISLASLVLVFFVCIFLIIRRIRISKEREINYKK